MFATVKAVVASILGTAGNDHLFGTAGDDKLYGLAGNDIIDGGAGNDVLDGGSGRNKLIGGEGDDTYIISTGIDTIVEGAQGGYDTALVSVAFFTLPNYVEKLQFTGKGTHIGYGNGLANDLVGSPTGHDMLFGLGGNDTLDDGGGRASMHGGAGNDTYIVTNARDTIIEKAGEGTDTVHASASFTLPANVEDLTLEGTGAINATGNAEANVIVGNAGNNVIDGGRGADTLTGGGGADAFVFRFIGKLDHAVDTITDFTSQDQIRMSLGDYAGLGHTGVLGADAFWAASGAKTAHDASDRVIYDTHTGALYYDPDGQGGTAAFEFAVLKGHPALDASHFLVIA